MILRKYGKSYHSVTPNFDSRAMTEIGFQKSGEHSVETGEFEAAYERVEGHELTAVAQGAVQDQVEKEMLESLRQQLLKLEDGLGDGSVVVIESEQGKDYPKTREKTTTTVVGNENKLQFERYIEPPLRVAVYRKR
jgi:UDP-N-acetyl-D-mannosaminuronate dehydrogenase